MKPSSTIRPATRQTGYALLLMVVALMGIGGVVITGFTQGAKQETDHQRYLYNQRVLREAKQALLMYAYNYPETALFFNGSIRGPGRLPCPDDDISGESGFGKPDPDLADNCVFPDNRPGRFPWDANGMQFHEARDASGEHLWYAVSDNFNNVDADYKINSSTQGTITIHGQGGQILYDGATAGVAAVIIAPGPPIRRNNTLQVRGTDAQKKDARNYLDLFGGLDNAEFIDADSGNGFVHGSIDNQAVGDLMGNDQMIVVTAAEVIAMAEMATLQAYRDAIHVYLGNVGCIGVTHDGTGITQAECLAHTGSGWNPVYPWLYNYRDVADIDDLSSFYPALAVFNDEIFVEGDPTATPPVLDTGYLFNYGRIPSIFGAYFSEADSQPIETWIDGSMSLFEPGSPNTFTLTETFCHVDCEFPLATSGSRDFVLDPGDEAPTLNIAFTQPLTDARFVDTADSPGESNGQITIAFPESPDPLESIPLNLYFLGEHRDQSTDWTLCPDGGDQLSDCEITSGSNTILHVYGDIVFSGPEVFEFDYKSPPTINWNRATGNGHATITATYPADAIISFPGDVSTINYAYGDWHPGDTEIDTDDKDYATGTVDMTGFSLGELTLVMRYFPVLPNWVLENGWHNSIRMAYADTYLPTVASKCVPLADGDDTNDCLTLPEERGAPRNIASLLVIAGEHDWVDEEAGNISDPDYGMADELRDVFDNGNHNNNRDFHNKRSIGVQNSVRGNDKILVIEELP